MNSIIKPKWCVPDSVKVLVTTRKFLSTQDFNISYANKNKFNTVVQNRNKLLKVLPSNPIFIKQAHGIKIINKIDKNQISYVADGIISKKRNEVLAILTADCMPIVISSTCGKLICILHVGRKGAEYNIIKNAFKILSKYNYEFVAWIGPCISSKFYLVDLNIKKLFEIINPEYEQFFSKSSNNLFSMDLIGIASSQLRKCNVNKIYLSNLCTFKNRDIFYSYRDSYDQRRFGTFVWIEDKKKGDK